MRNIVEAQWSDEECDFNAQDLDARQGHLFLDLREVSEFLSSQGY
jgi:hypothetical protein